MGAGKTSIGRQLAEYLQWDFVDLDDFITRFYNKTPADIIRQHDERALRIAENRALNQLLVERDNIVLALGGGTLTEVFNQRLIDTYTFHIFIDTPPELIKRHLQHNAGDRPLWINDEHERSRHYQQRLPAYRKARLIFSNTYDSPESATNALIKLLSETPQIKIPKNNKPRNDIR